MPTDSDAVPLMRETFAFSPEQSDSLHATIDHLLEALGGDDVQLLGLGEPIHGIEEPFVLRNAMFRRLVDHHGFTAIAMETSFPRGLLVNDYVHRHVAETFDQVRNAGFSHGFGKPSATRELIDWIRNHNAAMSADRQLNFYGFDGPMEMTHTDSPRQSIMLALDAFAKLNAASADAFRSRIEPLLGDDAAWENPQANMDASRSIGDSPAARSLRAEANELLNVLSQWRHEGGDTADEPMALNRLDAQHFANAAARILAYHHAVATLPADKRFAGMLSLRDAIMGEHLQYIVRREQLRGGRVLVFAHNSHLQRGMASWQWGPNLIEWQPAGMHATAHLGKAYAIIATVVGTVPEFDVLALEPGTLEAALCATPGPNRAVLTRDIRASGHPFTPRVIPNHRFVPLTSHYLADFDAIIAFDTANTQLVE